MCPMHIKQKVMEHEAVHESAVCLSGQEVQWHLGQLDPLSRIVQPVGPGK